MPPSPGPFEVKSFGTLDDADPHRHEVIPFTPSKREHEHLPATHSTNTLIDAQERLVFHRRALAPVAPGTEAEKTEEEFTPERNFTCPNYGRCLSLAAALDWHSFACTNCSQEINQHLIWRARHRLRADPQLARLFGLPLHHRLDHKPLLTPERR